MPSTSFSHIRKRFFYENNNERQRQHDIISMIKMQSSLRSSYFTLMWSCNEILYTLINYIHDYKSFINYFTKNYFFLWFLRFFFLNIFDRLRKILLLHVTFFQSAEMTYKLVYWLLIHAYDKYIIILFATFFFFFSDFNIIKNCLGLKYF